MIESFDESLSPLCKDNISDSALDLRKNLMEYHHDLQIKEKPEEPGTSSQNKENKTSKVTSSNPAISSFTKVLSCADVRSEIKILCDKADGRGLRNYIIDDMKEVKTLRNELPLALCEVPDAAKLVMNALEPPFFPNRKPYIVLLESLYNIFGNGDSGVVPSDVKDSVREFAKAWREEVKIEKNMDLAISSFTKVLSCVDVRSDIKTLCDKADGRGLRKYIMNNMKAVEILRNELPVALRKAPDVARLVMNALELPFSTNRKACILLLESLYNIFGNDDSCVVPSDVKDSAREIAKAWRKEVKIEKNTGRAGRKKIRAFLKFLASFRIAADYDRDELWGLLLAVSSEVQTVELCRSLGLTPNVSEFIDKLSKSGKYIEALKYADAFGMLDKVDHVDLLTSYLRDVERAGKEVMMIAQGTTASQTPDDMARLQSYADDKLKAAMRGVIRLVRKYGLRSHFFKDKLRNLELRKLEQKKEDRIENNKIAKKERMLLKKKAAMEKAEQEDGKKAAGKKAQEKKEKDGKKAAGKKAQEKEEQEDGKKAGEKKAQEKEEQEDGKKAGEKKAQEKEDGMKAAEKKAPEREDGKKAAEKKAQEKEEKDGKKAAEKKAQEREEKEDGKKDAEKKAQEKEEQEDREKDAEKKAQHKRCQSFDSGYGISERENYVSKRAKHASLNETTRVAKKKAEQEEDGKKEEKEDRTKAAEKKVQEKEDGKKDVEKKAQHKRRQSFEPGYGLSERENYASKRAKDASLNETTRVAGGIDNSKASPYNIDGVQNKLIMMYGHDHHTSAFSAANTGLDASLNETTRVAGGIDNSKASPYNIDGVQNKLIMMYGHDHHTSAFSAANTGLAAGAFASAPSIAAQINNERRRHEGYPLAFGTSNQTPIGSSLYSSSVPAGAFAFPLPNVAEVNYEGRGQQSYTMNFGEVNKNHVRTSVYGTGDLANSFATQSNYNFEGRGEKSYQLNFGEIRNNPVKQSAYVTGVSSATQCHYERRVPELYTSTFGGGNTAGIVSSLYGSNPCTIPSVVNQGTHERSLGQSSGFAGRNMVPAESSGYESGVSTVRPSSVSQDHFERKGSVIDRYRFNSG